MNRLFTYLLRTLTTLHFNAGIFTGKVARGLLLGILSLGLAACDSTTPVQTAHPPQPTSPPISLPTTVVPLPTATATPLPPPARLLTICLGREPRSLFLYDANSLSTRSVLAAVYDGPFDTHSFTPQAVIVEKVPSLADGDAGLQQVEVKPGDLLVDTSGILVLLAEDVSYRPSGCAQSECAMQYSGDQPVLMDQVSIRFHLKPGLLWSDGAPLTVDDSLYSYEVAQALYPAALPDLLGRTASYLALDDLTVEWLGVPGYQDGSYEDKFFSPLPRHAWGMLAAQDLLAQEISSRTPLGWGPYVIDEWTAGDHISLHKNPAYFRAAEGLPYFDNLVYRFVADGEEALQALLAGECDLVDQTAMLEAQAGRIAELQNAGRLQVYLKPGTAWELITFGITPFEDEQPGYFEPKEVRQAVAMCIDRQTLVDAFGKGLLTVADSYVPASHPLFNPEAALPGYDPQQALELLNAAGWQDLDGDPATPLTAQGVPGVADGTPFEVDYLVSPDAARQAAAQQVQINLGQCGIKVDLLTQPFQEYLAAGPQGPVFGRKFGLAQLAWMTATEPPCYLYLTNEIPGPYPEYPKGWGGVNAAGYSSPQYDAACTDALFSLPDLPQHTQAHFQAQAIFTEDLPSLPLYWNFQMMASRVDLCGLAFDPSAPTALQNMETLDYGEGCE